MPQRTLDHARLKSNQYAKYVPSTMAACPSVVASDGASQLQNHFDAFYEDLWCELCKYGELEELVVCDNNNDRESHFRICHAFMVPMNSLKPLCADT